MRFWLLPSTRRLLLGSALSLGIAGALGGGNLGCATMRLQSAESMSFRLAPGTPEDASVFIDEEYIGPLAYVAAHGVRLPTGKHRITVEKNGYFPWDALVVSNRGPIHLEVALTAIPD